MMKVSDYREHADECRRLARQSSLPHIREQLLKMSETWGQLAEQRAEELGRKAIRLLRLKDDRIQL